MMRVWSPSSGSTLMTSAPWSASSMVQNGPASIWVRSTMRMPSRAPAALPDRGPPGPLMSMMRAWRPAVRRESPVPPVAAALQQHRALAFEDLLVVLVHAVVAEAHDAGIGPLAVALFQHLGVAVERVAVMHRRLQPDLVEAELH